MNVPVLPARLRLAALGLGVLARSLGANSVCAFTLAGLHADPAFANGPSLTLLGFALVALPAVVLAPLAGMLAGTAERRWVLLGATAFGLAAVGLAWLRGGVWLGCVGLLAVESTFFTTARLGLMPAAARATRFPLNQIHAILGVAFVGGMVAGIWYGWNHAPVLGQPEDLSPVAVGGAAYAVALLLLVPVRFALEPGESGSPNAGLIGPFLRTFGSVLASRDTRNPLLGLAGATAVVGFVVQEWLVFWYDFGLAVVIGLVVGGMHGHPHRALGIAPFAFTGLFGFALWGYLAGDFSGAVWGLGVCVGAVFAPLATNYQIYQRPGEEERQGDKETGRQGEQLPSSSPCLPVSLSPCLPSQGTAASVLLFVVGFVLLAVTGLLAIGRQSPALELPGVGLGLVGLTGVLAVFGWWVLFRPAVELTAEVLLAPLYRIRGTGPGLGQMPPRGPYLVIANHAAWFDPLWLGKVVPARTTPMMVSRFYDLPVIRWFMRVFGTIRVPDVGFRREAPEIQDAVAALDRGECVVIFPEGWLRRKEGQLLRRFGQGIWQILKARPETPVFACWIEGGWGSYTSYFNGPPTKNKRLDFRRLVRIAVAACRTVEPKVLEDHLATRAYLMNACLEARALLGLPPAPLAQMPDEEKAEERRTTPGNGEREVKS